MPVPLVVWMQAEPARSSASLLLALAAVATVAGVVAAILWQRRRHRAELNELARRYGFEEVSEAADETIHLEVIELFGEGPRIERLLHKPMGGMDLHLARLRIPLYRVDEGGVWDQSVQESQVKLVLLASGFKSPLPAFRLMPNSWALSTVRGEEANLFHDVVPMGWRNYVIGADEAWIHHVLAGEPSHLLRRNKHLTIDSRGGFLAFYLQDERPQPRDLVGFVDMCIAIAEAIGKRADGYVQPDGASA